MNALPEPLLPAIADLAKLDQWVISKPVRRRGKVDKPPFSPMLDADHPKPWMCSHSDPSHWGSYSVAIAAKTYYGFDWPGFVFTHDDPYSGIDLDGCCKPGRERIQSRDDIEAWAIDIIDRANSYTETSPSGKGVKIFVRGTLAHTIKHSLGQHKGVEVYSDKRYFTVTGCHLSETPTEIHDAQTVLDQLEREYGSARPAPQSPTTEQEQRGLSRVRSGRQNGERASLDAVKARFNAEHPLSNLLLSYGAVQRSDKDYSCPFCRHSHTNTLFIYEGRVFSRSPFCKIPQKRGLDAFGLYCLIEHNDDLTAALKAFNPIEARKGTIEQPPLVEPERRQQSAAQLADAQRKRESRSAEADEIRMAVRQRAQQDERLTPCDRATLNAMLDWAGEQGGACCWLGRAAIAERAQYSEGAIKRSVMRLEQFGYFKSSGKGGRPIDTARRTFLRGSCLQPETIAEANLDPREKDLHLVDTEDRTISRGSCLQPETIAEANLDPREKNLHLVDAEDRTISRGSCLQPETIVVADDDPRIDLASNHDYTHGASERGRASAAAVELVVQEPSSEAWRLSCDKRGMYFLRGPGGVARPVGFNTERAEQRLAEKLDRPCLVSPPEDAQEATDELRASFEPATALPPSGRAYTGRVKDLQGFTECYEAATDAIRVRQDVADVADLEHEPEQHQLLGPALRMPVRPDRVSATDRYRADLALMPTPKLAEERKKHKATLKKYAGAVWLASVQTKLELVKAEIELRKRSTQAMRGGANGRAAPPHKLSRRVRAA